MQLSMRPAPEIPDSMKTDQLISCLSERLTHTSRHVIAIRMAVAVGIGVAVALLLVVRVFGTRPDLHQAVFLFPFWLKWGYTVSLCAVAGAMTLQLARPGATTMHMGWLALPVVALASVAGVELAHSPLPQWHQLWLGHSAFHCPVRVGALSASIFAGLCIALRHSAPTRLRLTGAVAGIAAGACAAALYALACDEVAASFVLAWYSLGIVLSAAIGALTGPSLLRW
jgi:hypothetical protein